MGGWAHRQQGGSGEMLWGGWGQGQCISPLPAFLHARAAQTAALTPLNTSTEGGGQRSTQLPLAPTLSTTTHHRTPPSPTTTSTPTPLPANPPRGRTFRPPTAALSR